MDYIYTAFHRAHVDGTPIVHPLWFIYPKDPATFSIDLQWFYGDSILVSPVTVENSTSVTIYLPRDVFYDFSTLSPMSQTGGNITLHNISITEIPLHIRGGRILPLRSKSTMTTTALRQQDFEFIVAPGIDGSAYGELYIDDGVSIVPASSTQLSMSFSSGSLCVNGTFGYPTAVKTSKVKFLGVEEKPKRVILDGQLVPSESVAFNTTAKVLDITVGLPLTRGFQISLE